MTDQPPAYETAADFLDRAGELFTQANQELTRGLGRNVDEDHMSCLYRANLLFTGASAGARIAQVMNGAVHLDLLREFEERVEGRTASEDGQPDAFPCSDCDYLAPSVPALRHHFSSAAHGRLPYVPPTLTGPYDPDREHDR